MTIAPAATWPTIQLPSLTSRAIAKTRKCPPSKHPGGPDTPVVLSQGSYFGDTIAKSDDYSRAIEAWRGIPYAQTTGGENRFRPPQPLPNALKPDTVYNAHNFGSICSDGEDCLNLNVYRPHFGDDAEADAQDMAKLGGEGKKLPVVVYVHGGGFNGGAGKERNMASFVSWAETPIVGISFNYRVGALGFLPSAVTQRAGLLNLGLQDQQMLLRWVQKNVASFGGDPDNVTLVGLSAGAHSIGHQLISYAPANKLTSDPVPFHKVIIESGGSTARAVFAPSHPLHETQFQEFLTACGLSNTPEDELFDQLRGLSLSKIQSASNTVWQKYYGSLRWAFQPSIDGTGGVVPDLPVQSWEKGNVLRIPIMTGFNTNEGAIFVPPKDSDSAALRRLMGNLIPALNETSLEVMEDIYPDPLNTTSGNELYIVQPPAGFGKQFWRLDDAYAHYAYICPALQTAHYASTSNSTAPVYVYHFAARSQAHGATDHGDEAPVVAHDMAVLDDFPGLVRAADAMTGFWTRFAAFGDPNPSSTSAASDSTYGTTWREFTSPFTSAGNDTGTNGQLAMFADGNDERMGARGRSSPGVPAQMINLTEREVEECQYWFDRVIYSEGFGNGTLTFV
ncbi:Alpha/Beta hydrolase protein [Xylariales sp. AK1849]|nr:Alpha/Beta hydrolase protein [Xylariales sp. AK1849]